MSDVTLGQVRNWHLAQAERYKPFDREAAAKHRAFAEAIDEALRRDGPPTPVYQRTRETTPSTAAVPNGVLETLQAIKEHALYSRDRFAISTQARVNCDDMIALVDRGLGMLAAAPNRSAESQGLPKPSWKDAPEWALWLAMDQDGCWWWYRHKPKRFEGEWWPREPSFGGVDFSRVDFIEGWEDTLEKRP